MQRKQKITICRGSDEQNHRSCNYKGVEDYKKATLTKPLGDEVTGCNESFKNEQLKKPAPLGGLRYDWIQRDQRSNTRLTLTKRSPANMFLWERSTSLLPAREIRGRHHCAAPAPRTGIWRKRILTVPNPQHTAGHSVCLSDQEKISGGEGFTEGNTAQQNTPGFPALPPLAA